MDLERIIDDIQQLEEMFEAPDISDMVSVAERGPIILEEKVWIRLSGCKRVPSEPGWKTGAINEPLCILETKFTSACFRCCW